MMQFAANIDTTLSGHPSGKPVELRMPGPVEPLTWNLRSMAPSPRCQAVAISLASQK